MIKRMAIAIFCVVSIFVLFIYTFALLFSSIGVSTKYFESVSPNGKNSLVVFEGGYIDAVYTAYPVKYRFFYQRQDNGFVSRHDFSFGAGIEVEWVSNNEAHVKVIIEGFEIRNGGNEDDTIIVTFD